MICKNCGKIVPDASKCPNCKRIAEVYRNEIDNLEQTEFSDKQSSGLISEDVLLGINELDVGENTVKINHHMKWHVTMLVFLWLGIITNVLTAILTAYMVFDESLGFEWFIIDAIIIVLSIFTFVVWLNLRKRKKTGPKLLTILYVINIILYVLYIGYD
ncbi:MAG: hypothetical protein LUD27_05605, partial [Clostridia bacterium]|nr:hypothetical protein [Clostridia bacterium]